MPGNRKQDEKAEFQIAPMIDCVFLLLIYFIMTSTMKRQEADLSFQLPGTVKQSEPLVIPDEQIIEITENGEVVLNNYVIGNVEDLRFVRLEAMLCRFRESCTANKTVPNITISPANNTVHQAIVKVMDACSESGIKGVKFAMTSD